MESLVKKLSSFIKDRFPKPVISREMFGGSPGPELRIAAVQIFSVLLQLTETLYWFKSYKGLEKLGENILVESGPCVEASRGENSPPASIGKLLSSQPPCDSQPVGGTGALILGPQVGPNFCLTQFGAVK